MIILIENNERLWNERTEKHRDDFHRATIDGVA